MFLNLIMETEIKLVFKCHFEFKQFFYENIKIKLQEQKTEQRIQYIEY